MRVNTVKMIKTTWVALSPMGISHHWYGPPSHYTHSYQFLTYKCQKNNTKGLKIQWTANAAAKGIRSHHDTTRWLVKVTVKSQPKHFQNQYLSFMKSDYET